MWRNIQYNIAKILGFSFKRGYGRVIRMKDDIGNHGGLTFNISINSRGWIAKCAEIPAIITGSDESKPSDEEIENLVKDAIFSAYNIPPYLSDDRLIKKESDFLKELKDRSSMTERFGFDNQVAYGL